MLQPAETLEKKHMRDLGTYQGTKGKENGVIERTDDQNSSFCFLSDQRAHCCKIEAKRGLRGFGPFIHIIQLHQNLVERRKNVKAIARNQKMDGL